jgi:plasmid maintenance system antidote protein VapI
MTVRASDVLRVFLRKAIDTRGWNTATVAQKVGVDRKAVRSLLAGKRSLTVDAAADILRVLELSEAELDGLMVAVGGVADLAEVAEDSGPDATEGRIRPVPDVEVEAVLPPDFQLDPYGNHTEQILRIGFALGVDVHLLARINLLEESGVPKLVLDQYSDYLPIRLDAAIHTYVKPRFFPDGVQLVLSFDTLRTCLLPWDCIEQVTLVPAALEPEEPDPELTEEPAKGPYLRLVKS